MREEKADLRAQVYALDRDKKSVELELASKQAEEIALKTHLKQLQQELDNQDSLV